MRVSNGWRQGRIEAEYGSEFSLHKEKAVDYEQGAHGEGVGRASSLGGESLSD